VIDSLAAQFLLAAALAAVWMLLLWLVQRATGNAGVVDAGWAAAVGGLGVLFALTTDAPTARRLLVAGMYGTWGLRLALYILRDRIVDREEDGRYEALRRRWGGRADLYFLAFFEAQALLALAFAAPAVVVLRKESAGLDLWDLAGAAVWVVALCGEALADRQLSRFRADPANRGRTCNVGLWRYSRHPNYFFEWLHWWSYVLLAVGSPWWWINLAAPGLMLLFLFKLTGIPATEAQAVKSRGDDYRRYQQTTSVFVPWPPRENRA
jgi:steroid 5-alpha reductase family enzyme